MAGRSFTRHTNGVGNRIRAEHINELQSALEEDDARIDLKADAGQLAALVSEVEGKAEQSDLATHEADTDNPHAVTKAQVGLGNVDNTSDMAKPVSTAQQAALDSKADVEDAVPGGGVYGQVLTVTHSGKQWVDPPGIVYPSLLLSPDGSYDRNGAVTLTPGTTGNPPAVVQGRYGQAWKFDEASTYLEAEIRDRVNVQRGTLLIRFRKDELGTFNGYLMSIGANGDGVTWVGFTTPRVANGGARQSWQTNRGSFDTASSFTAIPLGQHVDSVFSWDGTALMTKPSWADTVTGTRVPPMVWGSANGIRVSWSTTQSIIGLVEAILVYDTILPAAELERVRTTPTTWTMQNTAVNMALQSQPPAGSPFLQMYPPNRKIAAGGATLRTAPGASTQAITTLAAGADVHDTGQTVTASSVSYTLVMTSLGQGWVPSSTLV